MPNTRALGGDAAARGMYRSVHHAAGGPPGWAGKDDHGHQCWPGLETQEREQTEKKVKANIYKVQGADIH